MSSLIPDSRDILARQAAASGFELEMDKRLLQEATSSLVVSLSSAIQRGPLRPKWSVPIYFDPRSRKAAYMAGCEFIEKGYRATVEEDLHEHRELVVIADPTELSPNVIGDRYRALAEALELDEETVWELALGELE